MTSNRHNTTLSPAGATSERGGSRPAVGNDAVLDAARDCVLAVGVRRTTLTDVARRAGVSRMTIYRRWPDVRTLVGDLMTREWVAVVAQAADGAAAPPTAPRQGQGGARHRIVAETVAGARAVREHPLMRKIIDVDPELLLPYVLDRTGASQKAFLERLEHGLRQGHADGSVRPGHPARQARVLLLTVQAFTLSLRTMTDESDPELASAAFDDELGRLVDQTLRP